MTGTEDRRRRWRGQEPDDRAAARRGQLVEACLELMAAGGAGSVSMRGVCRAAGLTERYFYENFDRLDDLLTAVLDTVALGARDTLLAALATAPAEPHALIRHQVAAFTDFLTADPRRGRVMFVQAQATPHLVAHGASLIGEFTGPLVEMFGGLGSPGARRRRADLEFDALAVFGALAFLYQRWLAGGLPHSRKRFVERVAGTIERIAGLNPDD